MTFRKLASLCHVPEPFSALVATLLQSERVLKRGRFREDTFTDLFAGALIPFAGPELEIAYPPEKSTGGDIDLIFENDAGRLHVRLQAKRLSAEREKGVAVPFDKRMYHQLLHRVKQKGGAWKYQYKILLGSRSQGVLPLYAFYNHKGACDDLANTTGKPHPRHKLAGVNLAFAQDIAAELTKRGRPSCRRMTRLRKHFFPLSHLLCPQRAKLGGFPHPSPQDVALELATTWDKLPGIGGKKKRGQKREEWVLKPLSGQTGEFGGVRVREGLERLQITIRSHEVRTR